MNAVDTNVLIYAYDESDMSRHVTASRLIESLDDGVLLWQVACEFIAATRRLNQASLAGDGAWERLEDIMQLLPLVSPTRPVLERARSLMRLHQLQFWDAMIHAACLETGVMRLYSEDVPGSVIPGLEVVNPFQQPDGSRD
jgi:predicted nucleic acid-binding protein